MSSSDSSFSAKKPRQHKSSNHHSSFLVARLTLLLLSLLRRLSSGVAARSSTTRSRRGGRTTTGADVHEQVLDVLALEGLGEELGPDGLDVGDFGGGDEGLELVGLDDHMCSLVSLFFEVCAKVEVMPYGDIDTIIREDEGRVGGCELGGGHGVLCCGSVLRRDGEVSAMPSTFLSRYVRDFFAWSLAGSSTGARGVRSTNL